MKTFKIINNSKFQELRSVWEDTYIRFEKQFYPLVMDDLVVISGYLERKLIDMLPQPMQIIKDGIIRNATLLNIKFNFEFNQEGGTILDIDPIFHIFGDNMDGYKYDGVIEQ